MMHVSPSRMMTSVIFVWHLVTKAEDVGMWDGKGGLKSVK